MVAPGPAPSLLPSCQAQQHPVVLLFTETGVILCPLPAVAAQGESSRVRHWSPGWQAGQVGTLGTLSPPGAVGTAPTMGILRTLSRHPSLLPANPAVFPQLRTGKPQELKGWDKRG